jgi:hypothetical protein
VSAESLILVAGILGAHPSVDSGCESLRYNLYGQSFPPEGKLGVCLAPPRLRVLVMSSPDPQHLRDELVQLLDLQLRVLEKQVFGVVTKAELREYERRHERICGLYNQLSKRKAAAA